MGLVEIASHLGGGRRAVLLAPPACDALLDEADEGRDAHARADQEGVLGLLGDAAQDGLVEAAAKGSRVAHRKLLEHRRLPWPFGRSIRLGDDAIDERHLFAKISVICMHACRLLGCAIWEEWA